MVSRARKNCGYARQWGIDVHKIDNNDDTIPLTTGNGNEVLVCEEIQDGT